MKSIHSVFVNIVIVSTLFGVAWEDVFGVDIASCFILLFIFAVLIFVSRIFFRKRNMTFESGSKYILLLSIVIFGFVFGALRMYFVQSDADNITNTYDVYLNEYVELRGVVIDEIDIREKYVNLILDTKKMSHDNGQLISNINGLNVLIKAPLYGGIEYGDSVVVRGKLLKPKNFKSENRREFDYVEYLKKDNIYYIIKYPNIKIVSRRNGTSVKMFLFDIKSEYIDTLARLMPEPEAGLAAGITVGAKRAMGEKLTKAFRNTGLIHIVVLSGFNITIMIVFLLRIFVYLPRKLVYVLVVTLVVLFTILTGANAPVVRASIMGVIGVFALLLKRTYVVERALALAAIVMVVWNPLVLLHDIAFQLSIVATYGLLYFARPIKKRLDIIVPKYLTVISDIVSVTVAAQIAVLPLLIYYMGEVSIVGVLVNILTLPVIPIAMLLSFLAGVFGIFLPILAQIFAYGAYVLLAYVVYIVEFFNALPITTLQIF